MAFRKRSMLAVALVAGFACAIPACSSSEDKGGKTSETNTGSIGLNLVVGGLNLSTVNMTITNTTLLAAPITKSINVSSNQATVSAFVGGLPTGAGYAVTLSATASDGTTCGSAAVPFTVLANQTVGVTVPIACGTGTAAPSRGNVSINGNVTVAPSCAYLTNVIVAPLQVGVGEQIDVSAIASKSTGVTFEWSATNGTFGAGTPTSSAPSTTYNCSVAGSQEITISLTTNPAANTGTCTADVIHATVNCVGGPVCGNGVTEAGEQCDPPATGTCSSSCQLIGGTGGAGGTGGTTGGTATGGTATGGTTGGTATGGTATGGTATGGTSTGGTTGGAATGGTSTGGTTGGTATGGTSTGGTATGGTSTGGAANACVTCQGTKCPGPVAARTTLCSGSNTAGTPFRPLCDAYEACIATTNCANIATDSYGNPEPRYCYCGTVDNDTCFAASATTTTPQGPCRDQIAALAGASQNPVVAAPAPAVVGNVLFDLSLPVGAEGQVLVCTQNNCDPNGYCAP